MRNVTKIQKAGITLHNINLRLFKGELTALLGPNGVGKTSLLKIVSGMIPFDEGEIFLEGKKITERMSDSIVYIPGDGGYINTLNEVENIFLKNNHTFLLRKKQEKAVFRLMKKEYGISVSDKSPKYYDTGDKKLIRIFSILKDKPKVCLIDEPLAYLNAKQKDTLLSILNEARNLGISILISTHDLEFAASYAGCSYILNENRIVRCVSNETENLSDVYHKIMDSFTGLGNPHDQVSSGAKSLFVQGLMGEGLSDGISFSLFQGECVGVLCAETLRKKRLMEVLAGMSEKTSGEMICRGKILRKHSLRDMKKQGIVYIPTVEESMIDHMIVSQYVVLNSMRRVSYFGCVNEKLLNYVAKYYINQILGEKPDQEIAFLHSAIEKLSFGEKNTIRLAQAICQNPSILLIESPTLGLDTKTKQHVQQVFHQLRAEGTTILINSTEDDDLRMCDRFIRI